ncbi:uncharacterized protein [Onthophagus taurus]|uniref:uncharacterized protein n=1 Tax=Onthophagus taurus TaxID=166361 RepID=UPI0039BDA96B
MLKQFLIPIISTILYLNNRDVEHNEKNFIIETEECKIPDFNPFNPEILKYFQDKLYLGQCNHGRPPLVGSTSSSIYFLENSKRFYGILPEDDSVICRYTPFYRVSRKLGWNKNIKFGPSVYFINSANIGKHEFILVECFYKNEPIYRDYFEFVPLKKGLKSEMKRNDTFNVLVIGFDGLSRLNFYRQFPKTKKVLESLKSRELFGYHAKSRKTILNLLPFLTGCSDEELKKNGTDYNCVFLWDYFKKHKYVTAYGDDAGIMENKDDYNLDYFMYLPEIVKDNDQNGDVTDCLGTREAYKVFLEYIKSFVNTMSGNNLKFFGYFFKTITSRGVILKPKIFDELLASFFNDPSIKNVLNNTVIVVFSDHGARLGPHRLTHQGSLEEKLPFISFYFPDNYKNIYEYSYTNYLINRYRLTTALEIHKALLFLAQLNSDTKFNDLRENYGRSVFRKIPETRSCEDVQIPLEYCACHSSREIPKQLPIIYDIALFLVEYINKMLPFNCKQLQLDKVLSARSINLRRFQKRIGSGIFFIVMIQTLPGNAQFEAFVNLASQDNKIVYTVIGDIKRINLYQTQSRCIDNDYIKNYCYCD